MNVHKHRIKMAKDRTMKDVEEYKNSTSQRSLKDESLTNSTTPPINDEELTIKVKRYRASLPK